MFKDNSLVMDLMRYNKDQVPGRSRPSAHVANLNNSLSAELTPDGLSSASAVHLPMTSGFIPLVQGQGGSSGEGRGASKGDNSASNKHSIGNQLSNGKDIVESFMSQAYPNFG